jgi:hypothetical protein
MQLRIKRILREEVFIKPQIINLINEFYDPQTSHPLSHFFETQNIPVSEKGLILKVIDHLINSSEIVEKNDGSLFLHINALPTPHYGFLINNSGDPKKDFRTYYENSYSDIISGIIKYLTDYLGFEGNSQKPYKYSGLIFYGLLIRIYEKYFSS